uniref:BTB domain-containing protein n=1 Tax=Caenorhabditis tropicalis TaxID=1561998 RepID=A0A1I7UDT8_9PELO
MNNKPFAYDSLKTIILYLDPNTRFLLSSRIPSIRSTEKAVPLKIKELAVGDHEIKVNKTIYEYGIYQVDCKIPYKVSGYNDLNRRWTCNVDEFGIRDFITEAGGVLPGYRGSETDLFGDRDFRFLRSSDSQLENLRKKLEDEKERYNQLLTYRPAENLNSDAAIAHLLQITSSVYFKSLPYYLIPEYRYKLYRNDEELVKRSIEYTKKRNEKMENELLPFENKRNNIRPKFEIHLTKSQYPSEPQVIERVNYTGDIHKAEESILKFMFSKRRHIVDARKFSISHDCPIALLPRDLKIRTPILGLPKNVSMEVVKSIIDASSLPLEELYIFVNEAQEMDPEFIKTTDLLYLCGEAEKLFPFLFSLTNQIVVIDFQCEDFLTDEEFVVLIRNWVETKKPLGTCFTLSNYQEEDTTRTLNFIRNQIDGAAGNDE